MAWIMRAAGGVGVAGEDLSQPGRPVQCVVGVTHLGHTVGVEQQDVTSRQPQVLGPRLAVVEQA
jgi:hypothetical protein